MVEISQEALNAILRRHNLGQVNEVFTPENGNINHTLIINGLYVIRFDVLDWGGVDRYAGDARVCDLLADSGIPVPRVIARDTSKSLVPYDYIIMTRLPGRTMSSRIQHLSETGHAHHILSDMFEHLAGMHRIELDGFGLLYEIEAGINKATWADFVNHHFATYLPPVRDLGFLTPEEIARVQAVLARMQPQLEAVLQGRLVHGDVHFENILHDETNLTGIIDFDWAMSGDPLWDFRTIDEMDYECPGVRRSLLASYMHTSNENVTEGWDRMTLYMIGQYLDYLATFPDDEIFVRRIRRQLLNDLKRLEASIKLD